jgi:hypothetical protein
MAETMQTIQTNNGLVLLDDDDFPKIKGLQLYVTSYGYVKCIVHTKDRFLHRLILGLKPSEKVYVDHIDRNKLNNQKSNLRVCSYQQNFFNTAKRDRPQATSRYKGVHWSKQRNYWIARITFKGKTVMVYSSDIEEECAYAYNVAATFLYKEFAYKNPVSITRPDIDLIVLKKLS